MFTLGFFLWNGLLRADRGGPQQKNDARGRMVSAGASGEKEKAIMNNNVDGMTIRLVGCALALLLLAGVTIYTGLFAKNADAHATAYMVQENHVAVEDVSWN